MRKIKIASQKYPDAYALVDDDDYEAMSGFKWHINGRGYVYTRANRNAPEVLMSRLLLEAALFPGCYVDHRDHDKLNHQRHNLRTVSNAQNQMNRRPNKGKRWKGVSFRAGFKNPYHAAIRVPAGATGSSRQLYLGCFPTPEAAQAAYNAKAIELFGEYAHPVAIQP